MSNEKSQMLPVKFMCPIAKFHQNTKTCERCQGEFSLFNRRHHCRVCGYCVCKDCSKNRAYVGADEVRVCTYCLHAHSPQGKQQEDRVTSSEQDTIRKPKEINTALPAASGFLPPTAVSLSSSMDSTENSTHNDQPSYEDVDKLELKSSDGVKSDPNLDTDPFFLNIELLNKDEVITARAEKRAGKGVIGKVVSYAATRLISDEKVIEQMCVVLLEKIQTVMGGMGITADIKTIFRLGGFSVLRIKILDAEKIQLLKATRGEAFADKFTQLLECLEFLGMEEALQRVNTTILERVQGNMMLKFAEMIPLRMAEQGVDVNCVVCSKEDQAEFFFTKLKEIQ